MNLVDMSSEQQSEVLTAAFRALVALLPEGTQVLIGAWTPGTLPAVLGTMPDEKQRQAVALVVHAVADHEADEKEGEKDKLGAYSDVLDEVIQEVTRGEYILMWGEADILSSNIQKPQRIDFVLRRVLEERARGN